jgi:hypothetical protein
MVFAHHPAQWLIALIIVEGVLKSIALWKAARNNQLYWFIALVIVNSVGVVPLIYIYFFQKNVNKKSKTSK